MHATAKLQIFALRANENVSEYIPHTRSAKFRDHPGLTLLYENPTDNDQRSSSTLTHFYVYDS